MAEEDRTGSTGPSGSRNTSPTASGAIDTIGRVAKPAGDYAVTEVDRGLASQIRVMLNANPNLPVTEDNVHLVVDNGYVTLEGWVPSDQDRLAVAERVSRINGVQGIDNQLRVGSGAGVVGRR
jgi:osmotically-inducible protein OsmY